MGLLALVPQKSSSVINQDWERSGTRSYAAAFTTDVDETVARNGLGFTINQPHPDDSGQVVTTISVDQGDAPGPFINPTNATDTNNGTQCYWWSVEIAYSPWNPIEHSPDGNPLDQPVDYSFDWQIDDQPVDWVYDNSGNQLNVCNSCGDPYDPTIVKDRLRGIIRVAYNAASYSPATLFAYGNQINSDTFWNFAPKTLKHTPAKMAQRLYSQFSGQVYFRLEEEFLFNPNGWDALVIDRGYRALNGAGYPVRIFDQYGQALSQPVLLDGSGHVLANPTTADAVLFNYQVYPSIAFNTVFAAIASLFS